MRVVVIIPALNEEDAIGKVIGDLPDGEVVQVIVVDNGSTDATAAIARSSGARVVSESERGYGAACLRGIEASREFAPDVIVFLDGDYSDYPGELSRLTGPIERGEVDMVIGSRMLGDRSRGALLPQAVVGNRLACTLMRLLWGARYTDLGPFRAIHVDALDRLGMQDRNFGWTIEMQIKAVQHDLRYSEVPVSYRPRIGTSKITGTVRGTVGASIKILVTIARLYLGHRARHLG
jgi:glycosyltransferase involved in cell wall biosynthesis